MFFDVKPDTKELVITGRPDKRYFYFTCALKSVYCGVNSVVGGAGFMLMTLEKHT